MKAYILDIAHKIRLYSGKLDNGNRLADRHWVELNDSSLTKRVYIFRTNGELLISENGIVKRGNWELLTNQKVILTIDNQSILFQNGFIDDTILALQIDGTQTYSIFVNEQKFNVRLSTISGVSMFLENRYIASRELSLSSNKFDSSYIKEREAVFVGILLLLAPIIFAMLSDDDRQILQASNARVFIFIPLLAIRIAVCNWAVNIAKRQNRDFRIIGFLAFIFPSITLIVLGNLGKLAVSK